MSSAETSASSTSNANVTAAMDNYILRECFMLISTHGAQILNFSIIREEKEEGMDDRTDHRVDFNCGKARGSSDSTFFRTLTTVFSSSM